MQASSVGQKSDCTSAFGTVILVRDREGALPNFTVKKCIIEQVAGSANHLG